MWSTRPDPPFTPLSLLQMSNVEGVFGEEELVPMLPSDEAIQEKHADVTPTPLPRFQILILLAVQLVESITSMSLYPFINQV